MKYITKILSIENYRIETEWSDSQIRIIDLENFVLSKSNNPNSTIAKLADLNVFNRVKCGNDTLYWEGLINCVDEFGNECVGDLDLAPELLLDLSYMPMKKAV